MAMFSTKYTNNDRAVSGTFLIFNDDVSISCITSSAPCSTTLNEIPDDHWNTTWKLYISDGSNNASVNNITINAGSGQTINGASSITINTNGGGVVIRVLNNSSFIALPSNQGTATVNGHIIADEGTLLPQQPVLDFVGNGVTAVNGPGNKTTVLIPGASLISLTNAAILVLIGAGTIIPGQFYLITDGGNSNGGVIVQGATSVSTTTYGAGLFLNADYQNVGNYSGVSGFVSQLGIWSSISLSVSIGNVVIYNNNHYKNITGSWGSEPSGDSTNWSVLARTATTGFILEVDFVKYDVVTNTIKYRADKRNNEVDLYIHSGANTLNDFQWGRDVSTYNKVLGNSSWQATNSYATLIGNFLQNGNLFDTTKSIEPGNISFNYISGDGEIASIYTKGSILRNIVNQASLLNISTLLDTGGEVNDNILQQGASMSFSSIDSTSKINKNTVTSLGKITCSGNITGSSINENEITTESILTFSSSTSGTVNMCEINSTTTVDLGALSSSYTKYKVRNGYSNWPASLDMSNGSIYAGTTLTIPATLAYVGVFTTLNSSSKTVTKILNGPASHPFSMKPDVGQTLIITITVVGSAVAGNVIADASTTVGGTTATGRTNGCDEFIFNMYGTFVGLILNHVWQ